MGSLTDEIREDIAAGGRLAEATARGLREDRERAEERANQRGESLCRCATARGPGCFNDVERGRQLCVDCRERGCTSRPGEVEFVERPKLPQPRPTLKNDLMHAAQIVDAFRQDCVGPRPDLEALALRLREAAQGRER